MGGEGTARVAEAEAGDVVSLGPTTPSLIVSVSSSSIALALLVDSESIVDEAEPFPFKTGYEASATAETDECSSSVASPSSSTVSAAEESASSASGVDPSGVEGNTGAVEGPRLRIVQKPDMGAKNGLRFEIVLVGVVDAVGVELSGSTLVERIEDSSPFVTGAVVLIELRSLEKRRRNISA